MENSNEYLNNLLNDYDEFIICTETDLKGNITYASGGFCKISGYTQSELLGSPHSIVRHPDNPKSLYEYIWATIQSGDSVRKYELKNLTKNGETYWVEADIYPIKDKDNNIVRYRSLRKNITSKKKFEDAQKQINNLVAELTLKAATEESKAYEAVKKSKMLQIDVVKTKEELNFFKDDIISIFTHELKTPLNAIINFSEYIYKNISKELTESRLEKIERFSQKVLNNGKIQYDMIETMLEAATIKAGKIEVVKKTESLESMLMPVINRYEGVYSKTIIKEIEDFEIFVDRKLCSIVFTNLLSNALKYSKSTVLIKVRKFANNFELRIEDDGQGIPLEQQENIFNMFTQTHADDVLKMEYQGTGIGLYTVGQLVDLCERKIVVGTSTRLGGASFMVRGKIK